MLIMFQEGIRVETFGARGACQTGFVVELRAGEGGQYWYECGRGHLEDIHSGEGDRPCDRDP